MGENIIAGSFLYVSKNADVGNEPSPGRRATRDAKDKKKEGMACRETRALTVTVWPGGLFIFLARPVICS